MILSIQEQEDLRFSDYIIIQRELFSRTPASYMRLHGVEWFFDNAHKQYTGKRQ